MTAEIAILNHSAVALAADSAVTIKTDTATKIYNSVDKIFELHETEPVGVMVYNQMSFLGYPIETLIKNFRKELKTKPQKLQTIKDYKKELISWLQSRFASQLEGDNSNVLAIYSNIIFDVKSAIANRTLYRGKLISKNFNRNAVELSVELLKELKKQKILAGFDENTLRTIRRKYSQQVRKEISSPIYGMKPSQKTIAAIEAYCHEYLIRKLTNLKTGFVIAGFGDSQDLPALEAFEIDGILEGNLRYADLHSHNLETDHEKSHIISFAQDDVIKLFLEGVDSSLFEYVRSQIEHLPKNITESDLFAAVHPDNKTKLSNIFSRFSQDLIENIRKYKLNHFDNRIRKFLAVLPKQEMANLAKSLIDLTSLQRRVTSAAETVGGDVDLALISKSDGFVWISRKHYFKAHLNPRFLANRYRSSTSDQGTPE